MTDEKKLPDFDLPGWEEPKREGLQAKMAGLEGWLANGYKKLCDMVKSKWGKESKVYRFLKSIEPGKKDDALDVLTQLKDTNQAENRLQSLLMIILILILVIALKTGPAKLNQIDQLKNDLTEQAQVIKMEEQNNEFLQKVAADENGLQERIHKVYAAVPDADEKAEEVIAMLEDIAAKNRIVIDAIGIRKVSESQLNYDDLIGVVDVYEYTFTLENNLPHILSFIGTLRNSLRLMDIMTLEIEEGKTGYRASFTLHTYNLAAATPDAEPATTTTTTNS
jgi:hypothetical protein